MIPSPIEKARELVYDYAKNHLCPTDSVSFGLGDVYVVMFTYVLGGWKALASTQLPDGCYYEVTFDSEKRRHYVDVYKRFDQKVDEGAIMTMEIAKRSQPENTASRATMWEKSSEMMFSNSYKERFQAEYIQLIERSNRLARVLRDWATDDLDFELSCPIDLLHQQYITMREYAKILQERAKIEGIEL